jgi:HSP20 family protein
MTTSTLTKNGGTVPALFENFFKPWNEWLEFESPFITRMLTVPAVNISETNHEYTISVAAPGMKKEDFDINLEGNALIVRCEKESKTEEKETRYTRKEYNYSSFSRSFTLPEEVSRENIQASYTDGLLSVTLPKKEEAKRISTKSISIR